MLRERGNQSRGALRRLFYRDGLNGTAQISVRPLALLFEIWTAFAILCCGMTRLMSAVPSAPNELCSTAVRQRDLH